MRMVGWRRGMVNSSHFSWRNAGDVETPVSWTTKLLPGSPGAQVSPLDAWCCVQEGPCLTDSNGRKRSKLLEWKPHRETFPQQIPQDWPKGSIPSHSMHRDCQASTCPSCEPTEAQVHPGWDPRGGTPGREGSPRGPSSAVGPTTPSLQKNHSMNVSFLFF